MIRETQSGDRAKTTATTVITIARPTKAMPIGWYVPKRRSIAYPTAAAAGISSDQDSPGACGVSVAAVSDAIAGASALGTGTYAGGIKPLLGGGMRCGQDI